MGKLTADTTWSLFPELVSSPLSIFLVPCFVPSSVQCIAGEEQFGCKGMLEDGIILIVGSTKTLSAMLKQFPQAFISSFAT